MKSKTLQQFCIKLSLYLLVTGGAMSLAYLFGFYPYIKAQDGSAISAGLSQPASATETNPANLNTTDANMVDPNATAEALKKQNEIKQAADARANEYTPKINPYKFTTSYIGDITSDEKDPFRKPRSLLDLEEEVSRPKRIQDNQIDEKMEAIRRWPLQQYKLIAVIWDVSNPKAMIADPDGKKHLLKRSYRIGDQDGLITNINEGSITVLQGNVPVVVSLYKGEN